MVYKKLDDINLGANSSGSNDFETMLNESLSKTQKKLYPGDPVKAQVLAVSKDYLIVSTGTPYDGLVSLEDMSLTQQDAASLVGQTLSLIVSELRGQDIVLKPKPTGRSKSSTFPSESSSKLMNKIIEGTVTRIEPYGVFLKFDASQEGMVHVSELSWSRIEDPNSFIKLGDKTKAKIISVDDHNGRLKIALSIRQLTESPWDQVKSQCSVGQVVSGKVSRFAPFGAFVEVLSGVEGLVPLSQISAQKRVNRAEEFLTLGQTITAVVKELDLDRKRISLSIKDAEQQVSLANEADAIKEFHAQRKQQESKFSSGGDLARKLQEALKKK